MSEIIDVLVKYIRNETGFTGPLEADDDLLSAGVLDSFNIVSLAMFAQERFGVELEGEDLVRDNLAKLSALAALIELRRGEPA
jgi:acyl carrier protein